MPENYYVIVGNDYARFADQPDVYTVSDFFENMTASRDWPGSDAIVVMGQGIGLRDREFIDSCLKKKDISCTYAIPTLATTEETHKHSEENILITSPQRLGAFNYRFDLAITDKLDRLSDHVTGRHVGAMLLMEAARQATIAALDLEYSKAGDQAYGLILDRFDSQFTGYLFPLRATLTTVIEEKETASKNISVAVKTTVSQCGADIAVLVLDVTLCGTSLLDKIEQRKSQMAVKQLRRMDGVELEQQGAQTC